MKLFDIIREMDGEADGMKGLGRASYDFIIQTPDAQAAVDALSNIDNYGSYAQGMRDPEAIKKIFGPSIPAQKIGAAWKSWNDLSDDGKDNKLKDIKSREPQKYEAGLKDVEKQYTDWKSEGNEGPIEDYLKLLPGKSLPKLITGSYFPLKTPDNLKKYSGKMEEGVHYLVDGDEITFPLENSPYATKAYLEKVVKTIMDNAGIKYQILRIEDTDSPEAAKVQRSSKSDAPPLSTTLPDRADASALRKTIQNKFSIPAAKYEIVPTEGGEVKLIVTGLTPSQRASIQAITTEYTRNLMKNKLRMQKLAGIITENEYNIKLMDILKELNIQPKPQLGKGDTFTAYPSKTYPDRVIKTASSPQDVEAHADMFKEYPEIFPKVYEVTDKYLVIEKLNQKPIEEYNKKVSDLAKKLLTSDNPQLPTSIKQFYIDFPSQQNGKLFANKLYDDFNSEYKGSLNTWDALKFTDYYVDPSFNIDSYIYPKNKNKKTKPMDAMWEALDPHFNWLIRQDSKVFNFSKKLNEFHEDVTENYDGLEDADWHGGNVGIDKNGKLKMLDF